MTGPAASGPPLADVPERRPVRSRTVLHQGPVWTIAREEFEYDGAVLTREVMRHPGAVAILALDEQDRALLIRQYRHAPGVREWEIPAGLLDEPSESPLAAAQRELAEEADLAAERWDLLAEFLHSPGGSDEAMRIYLARDVRSLPAYERSAEEAGIETTWSPLDEVVDAVLARRLQSPSLTFGVLAAAAARARGWRTLGDADEPWARHPRLGEPPWAAPSGG